MQPIRINLKLLKAQHQLILNSDLVLTEEGDGLETLLSELLFQLENSDGKITIYTTKTE